MIVEQDIKDNKIVQLLEEIDAVHLYLDQYSIPRINMNGNKYSINGRINILVRNTQNDTMSRNGITLSEY